MIATEKGLNSSSRVKLESLAEHLKLPQELFEEGLALLQTSNDNLSHYETAFVKFLDKELSKTSGGLISLGTEKEAIELAARKYQINSTRAEQLIELRTRANKITRLSPKEAETFAEQLIVDRVAELTTVNDELRNRLYKIGKKWAYSREQVDQIVLQQIQQNRSRQQSLGPKIYVAVSLTLLVTVLIIGFAFGWKPFKSTATATLAGPSVKAKSPSFQLAPQTTHEQLKAIAQANASLRELTKKIGSNDQAVRRLGYRQLTRTVCSDDRFDDTKLSLLMEKLFYEDESELAVMEILAVLGESLHSWALEPDASTADLQIAYRANQILGRLCFSPARESTENAARQGQVKKLIRELIQIPIVLESGQLNYLKNSESVIATQQWTQLLRACENSPEIASAYLTPICNLTSSKIEPDQLDDYRDEAIISLVRADNTQVEPLMDLVRKSLMSCDEETIRQWLSVHVKSNHEPLRDLIGPLLLERLDLNPKSNLPSDITTAIDQYVRANRLKQFESVIVRNTKLSQAIARLLAKTENSGDFSTPDQIAEVVLMQNTQMAFCASIENSAQTNDLPYRQFDRLFALSPPRLRDLISLPLDRNAKQSTDTASATASDNRRKDSSLERLRELKPDESGLRRLALNQLARIAPEFKTISYAEATILASYFLSNLSTEENLKIQQSIESFSHWPNLPLAIADRLPLSKVPRDQALTVARLLLNRDFAPSDQNWQKDLQSKIMEAVSKDIMTQVSVDPNNRNSDWERLRIYLVDSYLTRLAIVTGPLTSTSSSGSPDEIALEILQIITRQRQRELAFADQKLLIEQLAPASELGRTILANQFLIQTLIDDLALTPFANEARQISQASLLDSSQTVIAGQQLYQTEISLLKLFALKRKLLVTQLTEVDE